MNNVSEFEVGLMTAECGDQDTLAGIQGVSQVRCTRRDDGSLVAPEPGMEAILLEALGLTDERREKLLRLKATIDGGRYFVSANDLAERLMASMLLD